MDKKKILKIFLSLLAIYTTLVVAFYYTAEEQLRFKESAGNFVITDHDSVTDEIVKDLLISQNFLNQVENIEELTVEFNKYYRSGSGNIVIELYDGERLLLVNTIPVEMVETVYNVPLNIPRTLQNLKNKVLTIKIHSANAENSGITVTLKQNIDSDSRVRIGSRVVKGSLCFSVKGTDSSNAYEIYWYFTIGLGLLLAGILFISYRDYCKNKYNYITSSILAIDRYSFLIKQLVSRDFKSKYKRSVLGVLWSFLNPLLTMMVQFFVFSTFFSADTKNYPVYLLVGVICFNFFKETADMSLASIVDNASLISKVYVPKYIFPFARTISSAINMTMSMVPLLIVTLFIGLSLHKTIFLMFYFIICLILFSLGVGMFLSCLMVFFRDTKFLWSVFSQVWMYATPIFYPAEIVPEKYRFILRINPLYHFIGNIRKCLINNISPEPLSYLYCAAFALISLGVGIVVFKKTQDKFTLYL